MLGRVKKLKSKVIVLLCMLGTVLVSCDSVDIHHLDQMDEKDNPEIILGLRLGHETSKMEKEAEKNGAYEHILKIKREDGWIESVNDGMAYNPFDDAIVGRLFFEELEIDGKEVLTTVKCSYYNKNKEFLPRITFKELGQIVDLSAESQESILEIVSNEYDIYRFDDIPALGQEDINRLVRSFQKKYGKTSTNKNSEPYAYHEKYRNGMYKLLEWRIGKITVKLEIDDFCPSEEIDGNNCGYRLGGYSLLASYDLNQEIMDQLFKVVGEKEQLKKKEEIQKNF